MNIIRLELPAKDLIAQREKFRLAKRCWCSHMLKPISTARITLPSIFPQINFTRKAMDIKSHPVVERHGWGG